MKTSFKKIISIIMLTLLAFSLVACGKKDEVVDDGEVTRATIVGSVNENTVKFSPNGTVMEISVMDYNDTSIDISGLEDYIKNEIDTYNSKNNSNITLLEYFEENNLVKTAIQYGNVSTFNDFNMMDIRVALYNPDDANDVRKSEKASANDAVVNVNPTEINEEELAEAGYDMEDIEQLESGELDMEGASETDAIATFTDAASSAVVNSGDIHDDSYMMIITGEPCVYQINGGTIRYYDKYATLVDASTVRTNGEHKSIIIYSFDY